MTINSFNPQDYQSRPLVQSHRTENAHYQVIRPTTLSRTPAVTHERATISYHRTKPYNRRPMLALLIAAHNEELVLANTINSAIAAGMRKEHIYVVDDNSSDSTSDIARAIIGASNVIKVGRSGKGLALTKGSKHFNLTRRYRWIHIADADGAFSENYFKIFRKNLRIEYAAATGFVRSLPGGPVSQYRVMEYTVGQEIHRRFQALTNTVTVIPGPTSCFRSDVFARVDFANGTLTEDFDVTLQIHRLKLGKIKFIPQAVTYTQDPRTIRDFKKQITRWNRGLLQGMRHHRIGRRGQRIDAYLTYQVAQNFMFFASYFVLVPYLALTRGAGEVVALAFLYDVLITAIITLATAARAKRWDIINAFPLIYMLRYISLFVFLKAFLDVVILRRFKSNDAKGGVWNTVQRYKPTTVR